MANMVTSALQMMPQAKSAETLANKPQFACLGFAENLQVVTQIKLHDVLLL